jgi:predicted DNA-binding transcriptional regulator YafY
VVERGFASMRYLVRDVLKEAGDAVVLEPDDARSAVREAAESLRAGASPVAAG